MLMNSLPVGGTITRIACGSTIRRMVLRVGHAERVRRLGLALVDGLDAGPARSPPCTRPRSGRGRAGRP